jgi:serine/threonine protein kinase
VECPGVEQLASFAEGVPDPGLVVHVESCAVCCEVLQMVREARCDSAPIATADDGSVPVAGTTIGRYVVLRDVGRGGMGEVYLAYDPILDRNLALKLVRADRASPSFSARLEREAQVLAKLAHPNVVRVFDAGTWRDTNYVAMEYLEGESVRTWCTIAQRSAQQILHVFVGAARGVAAAHALGVAHRDIKPDNILVGHDGGGRIADFGLVSSIPSGREVEDGERGDASHRRVEGLLTDGRTARGTLGYQAPEVTAGGTADARSDQWSFCAALCEMLLGNLPTSTTSLGSIQGARRLPAAALRTLRRGLAADPDRRFASMDELAASLAQRSHRVGYAIAGILVTLAVIAAAAVIGHTGKSDPLAHCDSEGSSAVVDAAPLHGDVFRRRFDVFGAGASVRLAAIDRELQSYTTRLGASASGACRLQPSNAQAAALQRNCVADRRRELVALVTALQTTDRAGLEEASIAIAKLTDPALCSDPARLATIVPIDPAKRAGAHQIADEVAALRARYLLGERSNMLPLARGLSDHAQRLGVATTSLETSSLLADMLATEGDLGAAIDEDLTAARHAAAARDDRTLAFRLISAAESAAVNMELDRAAALLASGQIIASRVDDRSLQDDLDTVTAELAIQRGKPEQAIPLARELVRRRREHEGPVSPEYLGSLHQLSRALLNAGQIAEARETARRGLADVTAGLGLDHPYAVTFVGQLGRIASASGDLVEARRQFEHALAITVTAYGENSLLAAQALASVAVALSLQGDHERAVQLGEKAVATSERLGGTKNLPVYLSNLGQAYVALGRTELGISTLERALALWEHQVGTESPQLLDLLAALGTASTGAHDLDAARRYWSRAVAIAQQMPTPPPFIVQVMRDLASVLDDRRAKQQLLADAAALERQLAAKTKPAGMK